VRGKKIKKENESMFADNEKNQRSKPVKGKGRRNAAVSEFKKGRG